MKSIGFGILALGTLGWVLREVSPSPAEFGRYSTGLVGRTKGQAHNARLGAERIDGAVIPPLEVFSFNKRVGSFSRDRGFRKAPVSYNGQLIIAYGGGVCQTSSTLYNAALLAGMKVVERHPHRFQPAYVPPGRDAAVAYENVDLRFQNPHPYPVTVRAQVKGNHLHVWFTGPEIPAELPEVLSDVRMVDEPLTLKVAPGRNRLVKGKPGYEVVVYRRWDEAEGTRRERISEDVYPPMHRLLPER